MLRKLKARMVLYDVDQLYISILLGRSHTYMTPRMTGKVPFTIDDIYVICDLLEIDQSEISEYFPRSSRVMKKTTRIRRAAL